mmetsp:Transcript_37929/g.55922  ORF Transcript_37929/g.55922 Transcript_37929/m.55922 type:complete len:309 (-) Transcript_37929:733-1659(-)
MNNHNMTPEGRQAVLESSAELFHTHLTGTAGTILTAKLRLAVAKCARTALWCQGCNDIPQRTCLRDATRFHALCQDLQHNDDNSFPELSQEASQVLVNMIHAIVRHQHRLDKTWHTQTIAALKKANIVDNDNDPHTIHALFCSIVLITAVSHGIQILFLVLDTPVPPLPTLEQVEKGAPDPLNPQFASFVKNVRQDEKVALSPYFCKKDLDTNSPEFQRVLEERDRNTFLKIIQYFQPVVAGCFAPAELIMFWDFGLKVYLAAFGSPAFFPSIFFSRKLDRKHHCASVSRHDIELVADAITEELQCAY